MCGRWVWVNSAGVCENGHPAGAVREVQLLKPRAAAAPPAVARSKTVAPRYRFWWRHSLWIAWTFTFGLLNWLPFFYIGSRARRVEWIGAGFLYLLPLLLVIASIGTSWFQPALLLYVFLAAVSILHAFLARPLYRAIMFDEAPAGTLPTPPSLLTQAMRTPLPQGIDEGVAAVIREAQVRVDRLAHAAERIDRPEVRRKVAALCATAGDILDELRKDPRQLELARGFLSYYLEAAERIVRGYADLSERELDSPEVRQTLARAEASLQGIQQAFDGQLAGLIQNELLDLDSEIALLEKTVQMDNLLSLPAADPAGRPLLSEAAPPAHGLPPPAEDNLPATHDSKTGGPR